MTQFHPLEKIQLEFDEQQKSKEISLMYNMKNSRVEKFQSPQKGFVKIILFYQLKGDNLVGTFGISEHGLSVTESDYFYFYVGLRKSFQSDEDMLKNIINTSVFRITTTQICSFSYPAANYRTIGNKELLIDCIFSIATFVSPNYSPFPNIHGVQNNLLSLLAFSFINLIPDIKEYNSNWPLISWLRQSQYSCDASLKDLYNIIFSNERNIDLATIVKGLKPYDTSSILFDSQEFQLIDERSKPMYIINHFCKNNQESDDEDIPYLTLSQVRKIVFLITRLISLEMGFRYHVSYSQPSANITLSENPHIIVFSPTFAINGIISPEIICNDKLYKFHSVVRENDGLFASTVYSPLTELYYEIRNNHFLPINRYYPPRYGKNEKYLMILYVLNDINKICKNSWPIKPFFAHYNTVNVIKCSLGNPIQNINNYETCITDFLDNKKYIYFPYVKNICPFPSVPLAQPCGKLVLQFEREKFNTTTYLIWQARKKEGKEFMYDYIPMIRDKLNLEKYTYGIIQDHYLVKLFHYPSVDISTKLLSDNPDGFRTINHDNFVCYENNVIKYNKNNFNEKDKHFFSIIFTNNSLQEKFLSFILTPFVVLMNIEAFDSFEEDLKKEYDVESIFFYYKGSWEKLEHPSTKQKKDLSNNGENTILVQLKQTQFP